MKKKLFLMACLAVAGMLSVKAQQSIIALHHQGNVTIYAGAKTQEAMDASVKGDTLYLSEGTFAGFNVTHGIVVLGSGEKTVVSGNITITGNDEKKDLGGYVFSGMNLLHNFVVNDSVNGLRMSQCQMNNFTVNNGNYLDNAEIVMSYIRSTLSLNERYDDEYGLDVISSKIRTVEYGGAKQGAVSFNHCNINSQLKKNFDDESYVHSSRMNTYKNCIVGTICYSTFLNCIYASTHHSYTARDCKQADFSFDENMNCLLSDDSLQTAGYLGDDGTVVGITGGDIPYTLELAAPHVVDHKVEVDNVNRKMTVTLKMAHEATKKEE